MNNNKKARKLLAAIVIALLTAGASSVALADSASISEYDAFDQGVALYEQIQNVTVEVPGQLVAAGYDETFVKSVVLGYANLDEYGDELYSEYISKQDFMNILYKTVISCNSDFVMTEDEAEQVLSEYFNDAYLKDENRISYAFMLKSGIIDESVNPTEEMNWEECADYVTKVREYFTSGETFEIGGGEITIGSHIDTVTDAFGNPNRIDESGYGFDWYVYNADYGDYFMVGVYGDRICAFFSNSENFLYNGVSSGDDFALAAQNVAECVTVFVDDDGKVDAVLYNPFAESDDSSASAKKAKSYELLDMINALRYKNSSGIYTFSDALNSEAFLASTNAQTSEEQSNVYEDSGNDIFTIYKNLLSSDETDIVSAPSNTAQAIGINTSVDKESGELVVQAVTNTNIVAGIPAVTEVSTDADESEEELTAPEEITTPIILSPSAEVAYDGTEDIVIELAMQAALDYHIEVFDYESDEYIVNKYVTTDETTFTLPAELFTKGRDYEIIVSSLAEDGSSLSSDPVLISYGSEYNTGVTITSPTASMTTEEDVIEVAWESEIYSDFYVDLYNQDGELIVSQVVEGENSVSIKGVDPGNYYLYITALRRGTIIEKAQDYVEFTVLQPEPVINEIILDEDEVYNFVYEDEQLGVLYFYDQELVDVEENGETVTKKKIIQKQVKATKGYKQLANMITYKPVSTTGSPFISSTQSTETGNAIVAEAEKYLGVSYVWGGTSPSGFDCSGLVQYVCASLGIDVDRVAEDQFTNGYAVTKDELMPGDLVFFENNGYIHHVGIYVGNGMMIHAPHTGDVVRYTSIESEYYQSQYAGARRVY
ncbi:MAG: NlpC/P60 family protein [Firmicutes bacterium]|nr:NlpC/P60 family protein [Bacillota bacterium]